MWILSNSSFFDEDYFENGIATGKSWYENYRWQPQRSFRESLALIDYLGLNNKSYVLDFGCGKGFLVRALRELQILADGCDISKYALKFAPAGCWDCSNNISFNLMSHFNYTNIVAKDVFEHLTPSELHVTLKNLAKLAPRLLCIVPFGHNGVYKIQEYHLDKSHIIAENRLWWEKEFKQAGWEEIEFLDHLPGIKDTWYKKEPTGNGVFYMERI